MRGYRNGEKIITCDGCFKPITKFNPKIHNITVGGKRGFHAHNRKCAREAKHKPPRDSPKCEICGYRIATGHPHINCKPKEST